MKLMILIVSEPTDGTVAEVSKLLTVRGEKVAFFCSKRFPSASVLAFAIDAKSETWVVDDFHQIHEFADVNSIWYRQAFPPFIPEHFTGEDADFIRRESSHLIRSLWYMLRDRFWINDWPSMVAADHKPYQLHIAKRIGLQIPRTLVTNDVDRVKHFFRECKSGMIYKPLTPYQLFRDAQNSESQRLIFTNEVTAAHIYRHGDAIRHAPGIFQEMVPKSTELRITVVGRELFPTEIYSQLAEESRVDWRCAADPHALQYTRCELPSALKVLIQQLMQSLGLVFGCLDFIITPSGEYVFLEVNPNGQWYWIQELTGYPIAECLCDLLARRYAHAGSS